MRETDNESVNPKPAPRRARLRLVVCLAILWVAGLAVGARVVADYDYGAAPPTAGVDAWPSAAAIARVDGRPTAVMFAHPHCPCTRASIDELTRVVTRAGDRLDVVVAFWKPSDFAAGWERAENWAAAAAIPGVRVVVDVDGLEARRFGAVTSGEVLLYGADGARLFAGGITPARGQIGASAGAEALVAAAAGGVPAAREAPVYGCPIIVESEVVAEPEVRRVDRM